MAQRLGRGSLDDWSAVDVFGVIGMLAVVGFVFLEFGLLAGAAVLAVSLAAAGLYTLNG